MEGGTTFEFVTEGIEAALDPAREAAGERDVAIAGGAATARQYLATGHVDELRLCSARASGCLTSSPGSSSSSSGQGAPIS